MKLTEMRFEWLPRGPLLSGYDYKFSREAEIIKGGEKKVAHYRSRTADHALTPSLLATAAKGVFRSAAAWLVERQGQRLQSEDDAERHYITADYVHAVPTKGGWRKKFGKLERKGAYFGLDPVARIFGDTGGTPEKSSNAMRRQGLVRFSFDSGDQLDTDALFGNPKNAGRQTFAWEEASNGKVKPLLSERLIPNQPARLNIRLTSGHQAHDEADHRLGIALLCLSADLISTGFFRFGRFTSRGYGWVRLTNPAAEQSDLADLAALAGPIQAAQISADSGSALAQNLLGTDPWAVIEKEVKAWMEIE